MNRTVIMLFSLFLFLKTPFCLLANEIETVISADQIFVETDNILRAKGNVKVRRGDVLIEAEEMIVDEKSNRIDFKDITNFFDGKAIKIEAQEAIISNDLSEGIISAVNILIDDTIKIRAGKVSFKDNAINTVNKIDRITSCEDCKNGTPLWHLTASSAVNDPKNKNIVYKNVVMKVSGFPVGYIPYLRLPSPEVDRASGFLIPTVNISSNLGVGIKIPYFIPIGDSRDLLLKPFISSNTKTAEYRYRQKLRNGSFNLVGAFSNDEISPGKTRSFYKVEGDFKLGYGIDLDIKGGNVSDDTYIDDYAFGTKDDFSTEVSLRKKLVDKNMFFNTRFAYVRDETDNFTIDEYYSLEGNYFRQLDQTLLPGNLALDVAGNSTLNVLQNDKFSRAPSSILVGLQHTIMHGSGPFEVSSQTFSQLISFVNSTDENSFNEETIFQYGSSSKLSLPMVNLKGNFTQMLSPKVMISFNGQEGRTEGEFFVSADELTLGNIFSGKKYSSLSESELGVSMSLGVDYSLGWSNQRSLDFSFGSSWIQDNTYNENKSAVLNPKITNHLASFQYQGSDTLSVSGRSLFDKKGNFLHNQLDSRLSFQDIQLDGIYEFVDALHDERLTNDIEYMGITSSYTGFENFNIKASGRYDFSENSIASSSSSIGIEIPFGFWNYQFSQSFESEEPNKTTLAAVYEDECTRASISLVNKNITSGSLTSIQTISLLIQLKPFGSFLLPGL